MALSLDTIVILTCERPAALAKCAESFAAHARRFGRNPELIICDDSRSDASVVGNLEVLSALRTRHGLRVRYCGRTERRSFIELLARESGADETLLEYAFFDPFETRYSPGANHNTSLLETAGRLFLSADDDTLCEPRSKGEDPQSFVRTEELDPTDLTPAGSLEEIRSALPAAEIDVLAALDHLLGKRLKDGTFVRLCLPGLAGDCGWRSPFFLFDLRGEAFDSLVRDQEAYHRIIRSRQIIRRVERTTVSRGAFCQTTFAGLDNREILPPFLPVLRGQDFVFSRMLALGIPRSANAYFPFCLLHVPLESREYTPEDHLLAPERRNILPIFLQLVRQVLRPNPAARGLAGVGRVLREHVSTPDFLRSLEPLSTRDSGVRAKHFKEVLDSRAGAPAYWREDVSSLVAGFERHANGGEFIAPEELVRHGPAKAQEIVQKIIVSYASLLEAWPTIVTATKKLRERGVTPARDLA